MNDIEPRIAVLEQIARDNLAALGRIERRLDGIEQRFDRRFEGSDARMTGIEARMQTQFLWLLGVMLGQFAALLGVMAHGFKWL